MSVLQNLRGKQNLWLRIALILSIGFLILTVIIWLLGYLVLTDSERRVLEQRLTITQSVANQIDWLLEDAVHGLEQVTLLADFDPSDQDLDAETRALEQIFTRLGSKTTGVAFLDHQERVILSYPPERVISDIDLSAWSEAEQSLSRQEIRFSDPYQEFPGGPPVSAILVPVKDGNQPSSLLVALIDLNNPAIVNSITSAIALGKTAHAVFVDDHGRTIISTFDLPILSPGEHFTFYQRSISDGQPIVEEVPFELELPGEPLGHHHIMAFVPLKTVPWGVSVGGDVGHETFSGVWRTFYMLAIFSLLAVALIWAATILFARKVLTPVGDTILKYDFSHKIANVDEWDKLIDYIVRLPSKIAPVSGARLTVINPDTGELELISEWSGNGDILKQLPLPAQLSEICETCSEAGNPAFRSLVPCTISEKHMAPGWLNCFCLPLVHQDSLVGTLHFALQEDISLVRSQVDILTSLAPDIAMAIESFQFHLSTLNQAEITRLERQRIARYLHDTLGQNVSYLRLRLDQLGDEIDVHEIAEIQQDLRRMGRIANEAYEQTRVFLLELQSDTQTDLIEALKSRVNAVADRNRLTFELTTEGDPVELPQHTKRRVLFICTEALNNIEQHADAHHMAIHVHWGGQDLTIAIHDDGRGFETNKSLPDGHFGLDIMHERAQMIGGKLYINSDSGDGTTVNLWLPILPG